MKYLILIAALMASALGGHSAAINTYPQTNSDWNVQYLGMVTNANGTFTTVRVPSVARPLPVERNWNALGSAEPQICLQSYPFFNANWGWQWMTNTFDYMVSNGLAVDSLDLDIPYLIRDGNGDVQVDNSMVAGGLTNAASVVHRYGKQLWISLERYHGLNTFTGGIYAPLFTNSYDTTTLDQVDRDVKSLYSRGVDGICIDHPGMASYTSNDWTRIETEFPKRVYSAIQDCYDTTNVFANGTFAGNLRGLNVFWMGVGNRDASFAVANDYDVYDMFIHENGLSGKTNIAAELSYRSWVNVMTNFSEWVRPYHRLYSFSIDTTIDSVTVTNVINLHSITATSFGITCASGKIFGPQGGSWGGLSSVNYGHSATNLQKALQASEVIAVLKDPAVRMGLPAWRYTNSDATTTEVWVKPLSGTNNNRQLFGDQFAVMVWNHSTNLWTTNTVSQEHVSTSMKGGLALWRDAWLKSDLSADAQGLNVTCAPMQTRMFTVKRVTPYASTLVVTTNIVSTNLITTPFNAYIPANGLYKVTFDFVLYGVSGTPTAYVSCTNSASAGWMVSSLGYWHGWTFATAYGKSNWQALQTPQLSSTGAGAIGDGNPNASLFSIDSNTSGGQIHIELVCQVTNAPVRLFLTGHAPGTAANTTIGRAVAEVRQIGF